MIYRMYKTTNYEIYDNFFYMENGGLGYLILTKDVLLEESFYKLDIIINNNYDNDNNKMRIINNKLIMDERYIYNFLRDIYNLKIEFQIECFLCDYCGVIYHLHYGRKTKIKHICYSCIMNRDLKNYKIHKTYKILVDKLCLDVAHNIMKF